jgi:hypothetical protein
MPELFASADAAPHLAGTPGDEGVFLRNPLTLLALPMYEALLEPERFKVAGIIPS